MTNRRVGKALVLALFIFPTSFTFGAMICFLETVSEGWFCRAGFPGAVWIHVDVTRYELSVAPLGRSDIDRGCVRARAPP